MIALVIAIVVLLVCFLAFAQSKEQTTTSGVSGNGSNYVSTGKGGVNNPGFLRVNILCNWVGCERPPTTEFENFDSMIHGARAWFVNLFGKVHSGAIKNTNQMIDVLTPAIAENPEQARRNYKTSVAQASSWQELGLRVFDFEDNPQWRVLTQQEKNNVISQSLTQAVQYCGKKYNWSGIPQYTLKP